MANEIFNMDRFAIEIVSAESFMDDDPGFKGKSYTVQTYIIRLNHVALKAWLAAAAADDREDDETWAVWHPGADRQITEADTGSFSVVRVLSEIFAVVYIPGVE